MLFSAAPTALVVVDMQQAFLRGPHAVPSGDGLLACAQELVQRARSAGALVLHLQNDGPPGSPDEPYTSGWELALSPVPGEAVLRKREDDGFMGTDLGALLEQHEVGAVAIAGLLSEMCVAATARAAMSRGLRVVLPRGAHGTYDILPDGNGGVAVPAAQVARVAEWSLGDDVVIVNAVADVRFSASRVPQIDVEGESRCS